MKKKTEFVVLLLFLTFAAFSAYMSYANMTQAAFSFSVNRKVILIDAGHGGWERGAWS